MSAFVLGATGEVGKELVRQIVQRKIFSQVVLIGRRKVEFEEPEFKDLVQRVVDFDSLDEYSDAFKDINVGFCCLGTTKGKSGAAGFYRVDHDYVLNSARIAKDSGCSEFHLVSSTGANAKSSFLYPKTKGEVEEAIKKLEYSKYFIYRPAILMCDRAESRPGEAVLRTILKPFAAVFPSTGTIPTTTVARAMLNAAVNPSAENGRIFENKELHEVGKAETQTPKASI